MVDVRLDHIGIAVDSIAQGKKVYEILGLVSTHEETVKSEKVKTSFLPFTNDCTLELLEANDKESPVAKFIEKRGPGIHHICFRVKNIREVLARLKKAGIQLINEEPKIGAHDMWVAFIHPKSTGGVLIELSEPRGDSKSHATR
ncbi:MAG: methylmalonyl-CoA epimerase [Pseudomonadota bacterium]|nr:methylmalonyl-CoA epimerase [Pseudomonadota bacterium]